MDKQFKMTVCANEQEAKAVKSRLRFFLEDIGYGHRDAWE